MAVVGQELEVTLLNYDLLSDYLMLCLCRLKLHKEKKRKKNLKVVSSPSFSCKKTPGSVARLEAGHCTSTWLGLGESACYPARPSLNQVKGLVFNCPQLQNSVSSF